MDNTLAAIFFITVIVALIIIGIKRKITGAGDAMKTYEIYTSPVGGIEAVKKGWSWPGFFFTLIWVFVKKLHGLGAGVLIIGVLLTSVSPFGLGLVFDIIVSLWLGSSGNAMRVANLKKRGYQVANMISEQTDEAAIALYIQQNSSQKQVSPPIEASNLSHPNEPTSKLINCPDCNKEVSRKASTCPNCGCPIAP